MKARYKRRRIVKIKKINPKIYFHERRLTFFSFSLAILFFPISSMALDIVPDHSKYYYKLNGGSDVSMPPVTTQKNITVGSDVNTDLGFVCDGFNPAVSVGNTFNDLSNSIEGLSTDVINSATSAIGTLGMYLLKQAAPETYDMIQDTMTDAKDTFHLSMKSCQEGLDQVKKGQSPYEDWFGVSDSQGWLNYAKGAKQGQSVDINTAKTEIMKDPKQYGIPWVHSGQNSGGSEGSQASIQVIYDVIVAGYNVLTDSSRALDDKSAPPSDSELTRFWKTPDAAGEWGQWVLGDITISAKSDKSTHPGAGLMTLLQVCPSIANNDLTCMSTLKEKLVQLISEGGVPSTEDLQAVSSSETLISPDVIASIRNMDAVDQAISVSKLSEDVAIQNVVDEALLLRRLLIAGSQTEPVHNLKPALATIQNTMDHLDQDIKDLTYESTIKEKMMSSTVQTILNTQTEKERDALANHDQTQAPASEAGAVYKQ